MKMRKEIDFIGTVEIPAKALYGIHAFRAANNFPAGLSFNIEWYKAIGLVKEACYITYKSFKEEAIKRYKDQSRSFRFMEDKTIDLLIVAAKEIATGKHIDHFIIPAINGGAGTSINLNICEIIANRALQLSGESCGDYDKIHPVEHANIYQSTNDVIPTALKVAAMSQLEHLEQDINRLRQKIEGLEGQYRNTVRIGYTQMQQAVPSTYGRLFSNYSDALSRDWWRVSKCFERIKVVNLGGNAIGTGIAVPRFFIMEVVSNLKRLTGLPVTRGENLSDTTSNLDSFVEIHGILKAHAVNMEKMAADMRLLASDLSVKEVALPDCQVGSSAMPGKVNPVIPEYVISAAHKIYANDQLICSLSGQGCLDLNAYIPIIGDALLNSLELLKGMNTSLTGHLFDGLIVHSRLAERNLYTSPVITTALIPYIGYRKATEMALKMRETGKDVFEINKILQYLSEKRINDLLAAEQLVKLGFSLKEIGNNE
ncbi:MAG: lyase family protein [Bacteroidales bacterium]|nr:lyase family protein [Bacteroidales bacterium]